MFPTEVRQRMSLAQVGRLMGLSDSEVGRLEQQALAKCRDALVGMMTGGVVLVSREWLVANAPARWVEAPVGEAEWPEFYAELVWRELERDDAIAKRRVEARTKQRTEAGRRKPEGGVKTELTERTET